MILHAMPYPLLRSDPVNEKGTACLSTCHPLTQRSIINSEKLKPC